MTEAKLAAFRAYYPERLNEFVDELDDYLAIQDWKAVKSFFFYATTPEDKAIKAILWGRTFMRHYFSNTTPDFHYELAYGFFTPENEYDAAPRGFAKAQSLESSILTPDGWRKMGDLQVGDFVIGADGKKKRVTGMSPVTEMDLYRLSTRDGRSTLCNLDHLWEVTCPSNMGDRKLVKTTKDILKNFESLRFDKRDGRVQIESRYFIETCLPIRFEEKELPIDPYTLGVWLGDGTSSSADVSSDDPEIFSYIPYESHKNKAKFRFHVFGIQKTLRKIGLLNNKHIPDAYKFASVKQREALLQGLIDTDGSILKNGRQFTFCNTNKRLFQDVVDIVRSLGGTVTCGEQLTRFDKDSEWKHSYRFSARIKKIKPVKLKRKIGRWKGSFRTRSAITSIKFEKKGLGRCIKVEDELYITDDYLVTHNTTLDQCCLAISCAYAWEKFVVYVEKTFTEAADVIGSVRSEFAENPLIKLVYGEMVGRKQDGSIPEKTKDTEGDLFINGVRLRAKGFDTTLRGLKDNENRPSLIILGDVEQDKRVRSIDQRIFYKQNYTQGVVPAVDVLGRVKVRGTILHEDSLLSELIRQHGGHIYSAFDPSFNIEKDREGIERTLLWPERWTYEALKKKHDEMLLEGLGSSKFSQEYLNIVLDDSTRAFQWDWLQKTFKDQDLEFLTLNRTVCFDVAQSKNQGADWTFCTVVDWSSENTWFIRHAERRHVNSPELVDWIFEVWAKWKPGKIGVEQLAFKDQVKPWLDQKSEQLGVYPIVEALETMGRSKEDRVKGALQGRAQSGKIVFEESPKDHTSILRGEIFDFPRGKNDDGPDSLAYHQSIGSRPFSAKKEVPSTLQDEIDDYFRSKRKPTFNRI